MYVLFTSVSISLHLKFNNGRTITSKSPLRGCIELNPNCVLKFGATVMVVQVLSAVIVHVYLHYTCIFVFSKSTSYTKQSNTLYVSIKPSYNELWLFLIIIDYMTKNK